jgi:hypothetical protein
VLPPRPAAAGTPAPDVNVQHHVHEHKHEHVHRVIGGGGGGASLLTESLRLPVEVRSAVAQPGATGESALRQLIEDMRTEMQEIRNEMNLLRAKAGQAPAAAAPQSGKVHD